MQRESDNNTPIPVRRREDPEKSLADRVSSKLEEGDFREAVRLASSPSTTLVADNPENLQKLKGKHPDSHPDTDIPPFQLATTDFHLSITPFMVRKAVFSFPAGSAGGPDGLRPQHLKDILGSCRDDLESDFLSSLSNFIGLVVGGEVPQAVRAFFFGASLIGLPKEDGGVRPIAIGCTLRRLAAKCVATTIKEEMGSLLCPIQLGYGTRRRAEAAVHAARICLSNLDVGQVMLKLDYSNAFNTIRQDRMLSAVLKNARKYIL